jgi:hypothetical protein
MSAKRRIRPVDVEDFLETFATTIRAISGLSRQTPSLRMTKIGWIEDVPLHKIQHCAIGLRPFRLH